MLVASGPAAAAGRPCRPATSPSFWVGLIVVFVINRICRLRVHLDPITSGDDQSSSPVCTPHRKR